jgi:hypothetical protein
MRKYRFFLHYNKSKKAMTVHFRGKCHIAKNVICEPETQTKWRTAQPMLVMQGWASLIIAGNDTILIR